jgi:outer membrane murein-binding lipoprotein Lpp
LTRPGIKIFVLAVFFLAGCGDKVPESQTSKKIGEQPKQIVDKVTSDVNKALQTGTAARQEAEKKE